MNQFEDSHKKSKAVSTAAAHALQMKSDGVVAQFTDQRPYADVQRKMREIANNSPHAEQFKVLQATADEHGHGVLSKEVSEKRLDARFQPIQRKLNAAALLKIDGKTQNEFKGMVPEGKYAEIVNRLSTVEEYMELFNKIKGDYPSLHSSIATGIQEKIKPKAKQARLAQLTALIDNFLNANGSPADQHVQGQGMILGQVVPQAPVVVGNALVNAVNNNNNNNNILDANAGLPPVHHAVRGNITPHGNFVGKNETIKNADLIKFVVNNHSGRAIEGDVLGKYIISLGVMNDAEWSVIYVVDVTGIARIDHFGPLGLVAASGI